MSTFQRNFMNIAQNCDGIIIVIDSRKNEHDQRKEIEVVLERFRINKPIVETTCNEYPDDVIERLWGHLNLIRVYTKEPGKQPAKKALVMEKKSDVRDAASSIHKDFLKFFRFARVWGKSAKHQGQAVGLEHILEDGDTLEIHIA
jgi:ribosome-interacting GTPase 1